MPKLLPPFAALLLALASFSLLSCDKSQEALEMRKKVSEAVDATKQWTASKWREFYRRNKSEVDGIERRIQSMRGQLSKKSKELQERYRPQLDEAERQLQRARKQIDRWANAGKDVWKNAQGELAKATRSLSKLLDDTAKGLEETAPKDK
jgi:TolA-binding protein